MGIKLDLNNPGTWIVWFSKRHPITRIPYGLRRKGIKSKAAAKKMEVELILEVEKRINKTIVPTWDAVLYEFPTYLRSRGLTEKTIENYDLCLRAHTLDEWSDRLVDSISGENIRNLVETRGKSLSHKKALVKFIRAVMKFCVEKGYLPFNPVPEFRFRKHQKLKKVLTENQAKVLLQKAHQLGVEWYPHWCLAIYTGMRNGELYALKWDRVNLEQRTIVINQSWNNKDGFKETKSGDDRIAEIAPPLLKVLMELKLECESDFVLPRLHKWDKGEQARELRLFLLGLGLPEVRFHDLRATWATIMLSRGVAPIKVMKMGGWKDIKTMQIYARKAGVDIRGMTDGLDLHDPNPEKAQVLSLER